MNGPGFETAIPERESCVGRYVLERQAAEMPQQVFADFLDGNHWTYADLHNQAARLAHGLAGLGVKRGDSVLLWLSNRPEALSAWFGITALGAVAVPVSVAYRGNSLLHAIKVAGARTIILDANLLDRLSDLENLGSIAPDHIVVVGSAPDFTSTQGPTVTRYEELVSRNRANTFPRLSEPIEPWDTQCVLFTSGTTGPSKAVLSSYLHQYVTMQTSLRYLDHNDRAFVSTPLSHVSGAGVITAMLSKGASIAFVERFSTSRFWQQVRTGGCTFTQIIGSMGSFLERQPVCEDERCTPLRAVHLAPVNQAGLRLCERAGLTAYSSFNMTEISSPLLTGPNPRSLLSCGRPRPGVEVRIVDEFDREVPEGTVGELVVRSNLPWSMSTGYLGQPDATLLAWRNGWFHTGDRFRRIEEGDYIFVDRSCDRIRRRGENVSSYEVEMAAGAHPMVKEAAAIGVPSPDGEEDVLLAFVSSTEAFCDPVVLIQHLIDSLPYFMVPRYLRQLGELPKTQTQRVQKHVLRQQGAKGAWDRDAAGIAVRRQG